MSENNLAELHAPIPIEQVDFRIQSISKTGWALLLAYKDARVDMDRLDLVMGIDNWQRKHELIDGQLFCHVGIWSDDKQQWVWKSDVGTESNTEKEKGRASDAFKRACFNLGIGRELYDYPLILVQLKEDEFYVDNSGQKPKGKATYDLRLKDWVWHMKTDVSESGKAAIKELVAVDENGKERFRYPRTGRPQDSSQEPQRDAQQSDQSQPSDEKPWYNSYNDEKANLQALVNKGTAPEDLVKHLRKTYKVNNKVNSAILALKPEKS